MPQGVETYSCGPHCVPLAAYKGGSLTRPTANFPLIPTVSCSPWPTPKDTIHTETHTCRGQCRGPCLADSRWDILHTLTPMAWLVQM